MIMTQYFCIMASWNFCIMCVTCVIITPDFTLSATLGIAHSQFIDIQITVPEHYILKLLYNPAVR